MKSILCRLACMSWVLLMSLSAFAVKKHALVIGLGTYKDISWNKINGDRDVPIVCAMLREFGYMHITTLVNEEATKAGIVTAFQHLLHCCEKGDQVYIHFSGHGQRMTDWNGDETDGWDEAWIPYDACLTYGSDDRGEKHLSDDEVGAWMTRIRNRIGQSGHIVLVVDACHSGDSSRELENEVVRGVIQNFQIPGAPAVRTRKLTENWLTLSACKSFQRNSEIRTKNGNYGMLSYALCSLRNTLKNMDNEALMNALKHFFNQHRGTLPQSPILTGNIHKNDVVDVFF